MNRKKTTMEQVPVRIYRLLRSYDLDGKTFGILTGQSCPTGCSRLKNPKDIKLGELLDIMTAKKIPMDELVHCFREE